MHILFRRVMVALALLGTTPASAHEFWLDAVTYRPKPGAKVPIVLRNGVNFLGDSYPFQRKWIQRFTVTDTAGMRAVKAIEGDDPAAEVALPRPGLAIIAAQRAPDTVDYASLAHFLEVLDDEGLETLASRYRARPDAPRRIQEVYSRFAKALLAVGPAAGMDTPLGLKLELVVETNPYVASPAEPLVARLLFEGRPAVGVMIKIFQRPAGNTSALEPRRLRTDAEGRVTISGLGAGEVLMSAALFSPVAPIADDEAMQTRWQSLWASTTFLRP